jgi:hypothetical protein
MEIVYLGIGVANWVCGGLSVAMGRKKGIEAELMLARHRPDTELQAKIGN